MTAANTVRHAELLDLFTMRVAEGGDQIAVRHGETSVSYATLDAWSDQLATKLVRAGVRAGDLVGLSVDRSPAVVAALLALLKVRAAYVALEPVVPLRRRRQILDDSAPTALLLDRTHDRYPSSTLPRVWVGPPPASLVEPVEPASGEPGDLFQVVYTSGTTGRPNGVAITHGSVLNRLTWMWRDHPFPDDAVLLAHKSYGLVAAPWELLGGLLRGVPTVLVDHEDLLDSDVLVPTLARHRITHLFLTPHLVELLLDSRRRHPDVPLAMRFVTSSADVLSPDLARRFLAEFPETTLVNLYGLTECSSNVAAYDLARLPADATRVPVGRPVAGARIAVLDRAGRPAPVGVTGTISVAGPVVAQGYWRQPGLTAERFGTDGEFRTGDLGRWLRSGDLEVVGRVDSQVKVRGFRVELAEIEAVLARAPGVLDAAVATLPGAGDPVLTAGVVGGDLAEVRAHVRDLLPDYMMPALVALDALPLNTNGKLDRVWLAELLTGAATGTVAKPADPESFEPGPQRRVAELWRDVLGIGPAGPEQNFFDAGGHSLLAVRLVARLRDDLGSDISLRKFYADPTVEGLATHVPQEVA